MTTSTRVEALLERLDVKRGSLVYLHTSFSRLHALQLTPGALIDAVLQRLGPEGTLAMPSFAWHTDRAARPWKGYADCFRRPPVFDVRDTPANIGVVPEVFRQRRDVSRSAGVWWSVAACGPLAAEVTAGQERVIFPYGPDSSFGRLHALNAQIVGLGVSLNTTSLAPVVDHRLGDRHPQRLFSETPMDGAVITADGRRVVTRSYWLLPAVVRQIRPSVVMARSAGLNGEVRRADAGESIHFSYPFRAYVREALALAAEAALHNRRRVPWLEEYDDGRANRGLAEPAA